MTGLTAPCLSRSGPKGAMLQPPNPGSLCPLPCVRGSACVIGMGPVVCDTLSLSLSLYFYTSFFEKEI